MNRFRTFGVYFAAALCVTMSGCPNGGVLGTFDIYIINATDSKTIGLVGLDNHEEKDLVDVLDENIPAGTVTVLTVSEAVYGDESGDVQISIVNDDFYTLNDVALGPERVIILVEDDGNDVNLRTMEYQD